MMNDEFVSHNKSSGGWDMLNKWVSMLKKRGCAADPLKGTVLCLKLKAALCFQRAEICGISSRLKNLGHTFSRRYEFAYLEHYMSGFLMVHNKRHLEGDLIIRASMCWYAKNVER